MAALDERPFGITAFNREANMARDVSHSGRTGKCGNNAGAAMTMDTGMVEELGPGLRRIVAPNPSSYTASGTNTYLLGEAEVAVIDPGPDKEIHLEAILDAVGSSANVSHILVTHPHVDHSLLADRLAQETGAPILAFGNYAAGRSEMMERLDAAGGIGGGEGRDYEFQPTRTIRDGEQLAGREWTLEAIWTPGHMGCHLCFASPDHNALFSGDIVLGWSTTLISPPDGDFLALMNSLQRLQERPETRYFPGHGPAIENPASVVAHHIAHRHKRNRQILEVLQSGPATASKVARRVYTELPSAMLGAATRNVLAHLVDMHDRGVVIAQPELCSEAVFTLIDRN